MSCRNQIDSRVVRLIRPKNSLSNINPTKVGGKLFFLLKASKFHKINIPSSYILNVTEVENYLSQNPYWDDYQKALWNTNLDEDFYYDQKSIQDFLSYFKTNPIILLENLALEILLLDSRSLMIRSNLDLEDGALGEKKLSFAGVFSSRKIKNPSKEKIQIVLGELFEQVFSYEVIKLLLTQGIMPKDLGVNFLLQPFVESEYSGVYFGRDPKNPWKQEGYIEWKKGGNANLLEGVDNGFNLHEGDVLPYGEMSEDAKPIFEVARELQKKFKGPLDIEWGMQDQVLWIFQIRPINDEIVRMSYEKDLGKNWSRKEVCERFPNPVTPLTWSSLARLLEENSVHLARFLGVRIKNSGSSGRYINGYIYSDLNYFRPPNIKIKLGQILNPFSRVIWSFVFHFFVFISNLFFMDRKRFWKWKKRNLKAAAMMAIDLSIFQRKTARIIKKWEKHLQKNKAKLKEWNNRCEQIELCKKSSNELLLLWEELDEISSLVLKNDLVIYFLGQYSFICLSFVFGKKWTLLNLKSNTNNHLNQMRYDIKKLYNLLSKDQCFEQFLKFKDINLLEKNSVDHWNKFMDQYGHWTDSWDFIHPTWKENSDPIIELLQLSSFLEEKAPKNQLIGEDNNRSVPGPFRTYLDRSIKILQMDEDLHFFTGHLIYSARKIINKISKYLVDQRILLNEDEIYYLNVRQIRKILRNQDRPLFWAAEMEKLTFKRFERSDEVDEIGKVHIGPSLQGEGTSFYKAQGRIVIVQSLTDFNKYVQSHSGPYILATKTPNPIYYSLFPYIEGWVTSTGASLSHGHVCAREFGLACVTQVDWNLLQNLHGTFVMIEGKTGLIKRVSLKNKGRLRERTAD